MKTKTLTIQLNDEQLPILPAEPGAHLTFTIHDSSNELELTGQPSRAAPAGESRFRYGGNHS